MLHQKRFDTITDLRTWVPESEGYAAEDLLMAYVPRSWFFDHDACGIFRLKDNFSTSGETHDGIFIIESTVLSDMYWKRIYKGKAKWFSSPITTCVGTGGSVTVTHDADTANKRWISIYNVDTSGGSANLTYTLSGCTTGLIGGGSSPFIFEKDTVNDQIKLETRRCQINITQLDISMPSDYVTLDADGDLYGTPTGWFIANTQSWVFRYHNGTDYRLMWLTEAGGTYSLNTTSSYLPRNWKMEFHGLKNRALGLDGNGPFQTIYYLSCYDYNSGTDSWDLVGDLWNTDEYWGSGKGAFGFAVNGDIFATNDEPPFQTEYYWLNYYSHPQNMGWINPTNPQQPGNDWRWTRAHIGYRKHYPQAPDTLLCLSSRSDTSTRSADLQNSSFEWKDFFYADGTGTNTYWAIPGWDGRFMWQDIDYDPVRCYASYGNSFSGDQVNLPLQNSTLFYMPTISATYEGGLRAAYTTAYWIGDWLFWGFNIWLWEPGGSQSTPYPIHAAWDLVITGDPSGDFYAEPANEGTYITAFPVADNKALICNYVYNSSYGTPTNKFAIANFSKTTSTSVESAYALKPASSFIVAPVTINTPTIVDGSSGGAIMRYALTDANDNLYKWSGTTWVTCTYTTANTKSEFLSATFTDAIAILGSRIGLCLVFHSDGTNTPYFESIDFTYTREGIWRVYESWRSPSYSGTDIEILNSTQTRYTNTTGTDYDVVLRVGIIEP